MAFHITIFSQDNTLSTKEIYKKSKEALREKDYKKTRKLLRILTERNPGDPKYRVIIVRTDLWEKSYNKAQKSVDKAFKIDKKNKEAFQIWYKLNQW